ncbi:MAG: NCS2 family permease [Clostridiales bacterium]|nr:NCS2 family permease [Clostridiales bacterium]
MSEEMKNVSTSEVAKPKTLGGRIDGYFQITKRGSTVRTEIVAGIVTFLAMCYILTVNPNQFFYAGTADPRWTAVFMSTAFGAIIGTLLMAFLAKLPLAQAPGMGLNSLVGSIIGGGLGFYAYTYSFSLANAMLMVLISGVIFLLLSVISIKGKSLRQLIFDGIPEGIRRAIPVGIGLFIAFIGFQNAKVIVDNQYTLVDLTAFSSMFTGDAATKLNVYNALVCIFGLIVIAILSHLKVKGAVIFGILAATILGIPLGVTNLSVLTGSVDGISWKFWENFANYFAGEHSVFAICFTEGFNFPAGSLFTVIMLVITMSMIDMFDTMGTCVGCCSAAGLMDEKGTPINYNKIMYSDSIATCAGAIMGTSTVTTFVESGAGIAAGGKTGLTALTTAIMFFLAIFALPLFAMIPSAAAASALVYVGVLMLKGVKDIDFSDVRTAVPAFLAIAIMPLGYSITKGIGMAILSYVIIGVLSYLVDLVKYAACKQENKEKPEWKVSIVTIVIALLFVVYFFVPTVIS